MTNETTMEVATTILNQLGGPRFTAMTGAKHFMGGEKFLSFRLPSNFAKDGINHVKVTLEASDTYTVTFGKIRGINYTVKSTSENIYAEDLQSIFKSETGLDTHM